uniref:Deoxyuridine 5'-triphosphate nucleotidohydrolase n=1 Tax=Trepomonas sp. PC1 TaxID=1076344 RepID=A0A146K2X0_9EUKA|eukprot:JAP90798.1 Deoxyuridine 5'-triphosphate nucleotidohydrolase [Trepomonas sp. PC1]
MHPTINVTSAKNGQIPQYQTKLASGADICAKLEEEITIPPNKTALIPTGMFLEIPAGFEGQVRSRSGLALKHQVSVLNCPGTIDADYRGEIKVILINHGESNFTVRNGDRIAQLVFCQVHQAIFSVGDLGKTERGQEGFGSTGK